MKKFLALYMVPANEMDRFTSQPPEEREKEMAEWKSWMDSHKESFADIGGPLGKNTRVSSAGVEEVSNLVGAYSIVTAESAGDAAAVFADIPNKDIDGSYVEVMEIKGM